MSDRGLRLAIVASTAGSVINEVFANDYFRGLVHSVIGDRACAAIDKARAHGIPAHVFDAPDVESFCQRLLDYAQEHQINYILSYYTNFYSKQLRDAYKDRIVNFHPSLLPAFKGMDGFGDSVAYHARFVGNTVEFIDEVMDEGKIIMQTVCPLDYCEPISLARHRVFVQQCKAVLQVAKWLDDGRITVEGRSVLISDARFDDPHFSPALDYQTAVELNPKLPVSS